MRTLLGLVALFVAGCSSAPALRCTADLNLPTCAPTDPVGSPSAEWTDGSGRVWSAVCDDTVVTFGHPATCTGGSVTNRGASCSTAHVGVCAHGPPRCAVVCDPNVPVGDADSAGDAGP